MSDSKKARNEKKQSALRKWKVVVTGASSKLAHSLLPLLVKKYNLVLLVRDKNKAKLARLPVGKVVEIDLETASIADLRGVVRGADAIVNLAGLVDFTAPQDKLFAVNAQATCKLVTACEIEKVLNFVHCSSISVYGLPPVNATENAPLRPVTNYGKSKLVGEQCVKRSKLNWIALRPGVIYGPNYLADFRVLTKLLEKHRAAIIGKGDNHLPLVYETDVASAFALALDSLRRGNKKVFRQCFTIVSSPQPTQLQCYTAVKKVFGLAIPERYVSINVASLMLNAYTAVSAILGGNKRTLSYDVLQVLAMNRLFDCSKAEKLLGWKAKIGIEKGLLALKGKLRD